jgi:hypothetical protein
LVAQGLKGGRRCDGYFELGELEAGCWGFLDVGGGGDFVDTTGRALLASMGFLTESEGACLQCFWDMV